MEPTVVDNPAAHRFEIRVDGEVAGFVTYTRGGSTLSLLHTEIDPSFEGRGLASKLVRGVLDAARASGSAVLPFCPFVRSYLGRHPDQIDLVPQDQRERFSLTTAAP